MQCLSLLCKADAIVSSRTDAGVHAKRNTFHVDLFRQNKSSINRLGIYPPNDIKTLLNSKLKDTQIRIVSSQIIPPWFHSRYNADYRHYIYRVMYNNNDGKRDRDAVTVMESDRAWYLPQRLNIDDMKVAFVLLSICIYMRIYIHM